MPISIAALLGAEIMPALLTPPVKVAPEIEIAGALLAAVMLLALSTSRPPAM
jgi:hypothetical protein